MRRTTSRRALLAALLALVGAPAAAREGLLDLEAGGAWATRNDVRIPGAGGTDLSLVNDLGAQAAPYLRARVGLLLGERHALLATWAPLRLTARGTLPRDVRFAGADFPAGSSVQARFVFDTYRLTYRYGLVRSPALDLDVGVTALVRDAAITLQGARYAEKVNTGLVPLLSLRVAWRFAGPLALTLDGDALAAPQGRAEDVQLALEAQVRPGVAVRAGWRVIEGGADNDEVYNFALVHHLGLGLSVFL